MLSSDQVYTPLSDYLKEENFTVYSDKRVDDLPLLAEELKKQRELYEYFIRKAQNFSNFGHVRILAALSLNDKQKEAVLKTSGPVLILVPHNCLLGEELRSLSPVA